MPATKPSATPFANAELIGGARVEVCRMIARIWALSRSFGLSFALATTSAGPGGLATGAGGCALDSAAAASNSGGAGGIVL